MNWYRTFKVMLTNFLTIKVTHRASNDNRKLKGINLRRLKNEMHRISYSLKRDAEKTNLQELSDKIRQDQRDQNPNNPTDDQPRQGE